MNFIEWAKRKFSNNNISKKIEEEKIQKNEHYTGESSILDKQREKVKELLYGKDEHIVVVEAK